jgi:hypothetical protein
MSCESGKIEACSHFSNRYTPPQLPTTMSITTEQIQAHRAARKASGLTGCITGRPVPPMSLHGYKDVQSWRPVDPMKPSCFCFDCRDLWDKDASIDLQLLNDGYETALWVYSELLPEEKRPGKKREDAPLATRTMTEHPEASKMGVPRGVFFPPPLRVNTSLGSYDTFEEMPTPLPAPRHRDAMNETETERLKKDLGELRAKIQGELVRTMDLRRRGVFYDEPERSEYLRSIDEQEKKLWMKLDAVELLMKE